MSDNKGILRAYTPVQLTDIFGNQVVRRVNVGTSWSASLEESKEMVMKAREQNPHLVIDAKLVFSL